MDFEELFHRFKDIKVAVIGDVMLDTYCWGHVERISPEAPVPVVTLDKKEYRIGGAGNVALNAASLGATVAVLSVIGDDDDGQVLNGLLAEKGIDTSMLMKRGDRMTTNKTRIISRNQQMIRLDSETTQDLSPETTTAFLGQIKKHLQHQKPQVVVFEDYNKGVLTAEVIASVIAWCKAHQILTTADPKRKNFFNYKGVDIFKPNLKEVREALNLHLDDINEPALRNIHRLLAAQLHHAISFITLSEKGIFYQQAEDAEIISSHFRNISDVSGAGDTVIAVASLVYAATGDIRLMGRIANIAGGLVCEEVGTAAIDKTRLLGECRLLLH